jgi:hypothetical protein
MLHEEHCLTGLPKTPTSSAALFPHLLIGRRISGILTLLALTPLLDTVLSPSLLSFAV